MWAPTARTWGATTPTRPPCGRRPAPEAVHAPLQTLTEARARVLACPAPRPAVVAIGGITPANVSQVAQAGADSAAVISGLFEAPDIQAAARACAAAFSVNP
ncbi:thiamine-phosphate pyrophosphorylase [Bordetella pertussis]|nr:thiamine-phosphate pyrophosphorylase [Bordetella pertussis]